MNQITASIAQQLTKKKGIVTEMQWYIYKLSAGCFSTGKFAYSFFKLLLGYNFIHYFIEYTLKRLCYKEKKRPIVNRTFHQYLFHD